MEKGADTTTLPWDINFIGLQAFGCGASTGQTLNSNNDWDSVNLDWLSEVVLSGIGDSQDGVTGFDSKPNVSPNGKEMGPGFIKAVHDKAGDLIEFIPPPSTDGSSVSNAGSNDSHEVPPQRCRWQFCTGRRSVNGSKEGNSIKPNTAGCIPVPTWLLRNTSSIGFHLVEERQKAYGKSSITKTMEPLTKDRYKDQKQREQEHHTAIR